MGGPALAGLEGGAENYALSAWLFERALGLIYGIAFVSLAVQIRGLIGERGIIPAAEMLLEEKRLLGRRRFRLLPTLCWWRCSDGFLLFLCWGGAFLAALLVIGVAPMAMLIALWIFYLSLLTVGGVWLGYQWDVLLLEAGFLAIFLAPLRILPSWPGTHGPSRLAVWLGWWLLFRLMFSSGMAKLLSGDPTWRRLTALTHHYETQPLPTPLSWYAHHLPVWLHKMSAAVMFAVEMAVPFLILGPWPLRPIAGIVFVAFMILIMLTGNYCFFNLLTIALCILLFDDRTWWWLLGWIDPGGEGGFLLASPATAQAASAAEQAGAGAAGSEFAYLSFWIVCIPAALLLLLSARPMSRLLGVPVRWPRRLDAFFVWLEPFHLVNGYGLFAVMTTIRPEIIVEGSDDGVTWRSYEFKWKPGDLGRRMRYVLPHQPRLDWQMWFAALSDYRYSPWFGSFVMRLMEGSPPVLALLRRYGAGELDSVSRRTIASGARPGNSTLSEEPTAASPRFIRAVLYQYRFSTPAARRATGVWWERDPLGPYCPTLVRDRMPERR